MSTPVRSSLPPAPLLLTDGSPAREAWMLDPAKLHLNHGSYGGVPKITSERQTALRDEMEADPLSWFLSLPEKVAAARAPIGQFLGAEPIHTALVPNVSAGMSTVLASLPLAPGAEIVVTNHGYGTVIAAARRQVERIGGRVVTVVIPLAAPDAEAADAVMAACTERTALVIVDQITSPTARRLPVADIVARARKLGIKTLVDAAHAPGMIDSPYVDADYWVGNLHKWACAPRGVAALVARPETSGHLHPLIDSWAAADPFPARFDIQGTVDWTAALSTERSIELIELEWGWERARAYITALADYAEDVVSRTLSEVTGEDHRVNVGTPADAMRLVRLPGNNPLDDGVGARLQGELLAEHGIAVQLPSFDGVGYWRLSAHVYTTAADFDEFAERAIPVVLNRLIGAR